jgi:DNA-binding NarL/FixJ family response regulator
MADDPLTPATETASSVPSKLLSEREWQIVVAALELSPRHAAIVGLILQGKRDKQIATDLGMSIWTVRTHLGRLFQRLGVADRMELALHVLAIPRIPTANERPH